LKLCPELCVWSIETMSKIVCVVYQLFKQVGKRVPGLPIRNCARSSNNRGPRWLKLSAIDVTVKTVFERLYLVSGLAPIGALSQLSVCSHTPTAQSTTISRFLCNFFPSGPSIVLSARLRVHQVKYKRSKNVSRRDKGGSAIMGRQRPGIVSWGPK
jgi:hypothetical protein